MSELRRVGLIAIAVLTVAFASIGCGVSTTGPNKLGDGIAAGPRNVADAPPGPDEAQGPLDLVSSYLSAAVETGTDQPLSRLQAFLTTQAVAALTSSVDTKNPPNPTVIRLLGPPKPGLFTQDRTPVDVAYEVVGVLNDQGRVDDLADPHTGSMRFWVKTAENNSKHLRIDEIDGAPQAIMISDQALKEFYQVQPVYFWDGASSRLIPDIHYVPNGLAADLRATRIVQWLCDGPSTWLRPLAQRLPTGTALKSQVVIHDGRLAVDLSLPAATGGAPAIQRLYRQLQWSLQSSAAAPRIDLSIEDKLQTNLGGLDDYRAYNLSYSLSQHGQTYDIVDGKVVVPAGTASPPPPPPVLTASQNASVVYAGVNRDASVMAVVRARTGDKRLYLQLIKNGGVVIGVDIGPTFDMGRPVWVSNDVMVIPANGRLYSVSAAGSVTDVTPGLVSGVHAVSVAPDARRIALIADGQTYLTSLNLGDNGTAVIGSNLRPVLAGQVAASAVAWVSEGWLEVAGVSGPAPSLWHVTADSVIADDLSSYLAGVTPFDLVAYPTAPFAPAPSAAEVLLVAGQNVYQVLLYQLNQDPKLKAPFFGL
jgi:hypothetical protein